MKKIEIWYQENWDLLKGEYEGEYFHESFDDEDEAIEYIQNRLDEELQEFKDKDPNISNEELLSRYRMFGTDYYLKTGKAGFCSWKYVEKKLFL